MAVTLSYTDQEFMAWLLTRLRGRVAEFLSWSVEEGDLDDVLEATLLAYPVEEIGTVPATVDGVKKLRALGLAELWTAVVEALTLEIDHSADGASFSRSQLLQNAERQLSRAASLADAYGWTSQTTARIAAVVDGNDPYEWSTEDDWTP